MTTLADIQAVIQSIKNDDPTSISLLQYALALLTGYVENNPPGGGITQLTGDVTAGPGSGSQAASVDKIQGVAVSSTPPSAVGEVLTWNGTSWAPAAALWSKSGTELSPATAGDTVAIEIPFGTAGVTVEDTSLSFFTEVRPANVVLSDNSVKFAELNANTATLRLEGDSAELPPVVPTLIANDAGGTPTTLDLVVGGLTLNGLPGNPGDVLTSNGSGAPTWQPASGGGTISGTIAANEIAFGTGVDSIGGDARLTWNPATGDLAVTDAGSVNTITVHTDPWPLIESTDSMNINVANFSGALGIQAGGNDLVLIGGDDGSGQSYVQTQSNVRLESKGRLLVQPATDGADGVEVRNSASDLLVQIDTASKTTTLTGDANPVLVLVDEIAAAPFLTATPVTREVAISDPVTLTDTTVINPTDVAVNNGTQTGNVSAGQVRVVDSGTGNTLALRIPGAVATLASEDGASNPFPLNLSIEELQVNANPGNAGEVLTSQGAGLPPTWSAATGAPRTFPINVSHNNSSVLWGPAVYLAGGFNPATSAARFYLPAMGDVGRVILSVDRVLGVAEFTTGVAPFAGLFDATFTAGISALAPGWYVFGVSNPAGPGSVTCLGINLT